MSSYRIILRGVELEVTPKQYAAWWAFWRSICDAVRREVAQSGSLADAPTKQAADAESPEAQEGCGTERRCASGQQQA